MTGAPPPPNPRASLRSGLAPYVFRFALAYVLALTVCGMMRFGLSRLVCLRTRSHRPRPLSCPRCAPRSSCLASGWARPLLSLGVCGVVAPPLSRSAGAELSSGDARGMRMAQPPPTRRRLARAVVALALCLRVLDTLRFSRGSPSGAGSAPKAVSARGFAPSGLICRLAHRGWRTTFAAQRVDAGESAVLGWGASGTSPRLRVRWLARQHPPAFHM